MTTGIILVSALTSALVTLVIEWFAKPRLEARKERLLDRHRARRAFEKNLVCVLSNSAKLATDAAYRLPRDINAELRLAIRQEVGRAVTQVEDATREMSDNLADYLFTYATDRIRGPILQYAYTARGVIMSSRTQHEKAGILIEITGPMHTWLFGGWHPISRVQAVLTLPGILAKYAGSTDSTNQ